MIYNKCDDRNNQSGCYDPTAYNALRKIKKDERRALIQKMNASRIMSYSPLQG